MRISPRPLRLLRETTFRRFWLGQTVSLLGDQVSLFAIPLVAVLFLHAGPAEMGYLTAVGILPSLLFSLHAGAWVDRRGHRRRTMLAADLGRAALLATIPLGYALGALTVGQLYAVAFLVGCLDVLFFVAYSTLFVAIVNPDDYLEGNTLLNGSRAVSSVAGQGLAGVLVTALTAPVAVAADALSFVASAVFLGRICPQEPLPSPPERGQVFAGIRFIARSAVMRAALGATATGNFFGFVSLALVTLYAVGTLGVRPLTLGLVLSAGAVGALVGTALAGPLSRRVGVGRAFAVGCFVFAAPQLLVPAASGNGLERLVLLFLAEFGSGLGVMILDITIGTIFAKVIPDAVRASVSGAYRMVNYGVRPLGALAAGVLGAAIGVRLTLWIAAVGGVFSVMWVIFSPLARGDEAVEPTSPAAREQREAVLDAAQ